MSKYLHDLVVQAAELRAVGYCWENVAMRVHRKARTCQKWPPRHKALWDPAYRVAQQKRFQDINNEASTHLNALMRSTDEKIQLKATEVWMKCGQAFAARVEAEPAVDEERERAYAIYRLINEDKERIRRQANEERRAAGRPPVTEAELNDLCDREWDSTPPDDPPEADVGPESVSPAGGVMGPVVAALLVGAVVALVRPSGVREAGPGGPTAVAVDGARPVARLQWIDGMGAGRAGDFRPGFRNPRLAGHFGRNSYAA